MSDENASEKDITKAEDELDVAMQGLIASNSGNDNSNSGNGNNDENNNGATNNNGNANSNGNNNNNNSNTNSNSSNSNNSNTSIPKTGAATSAVTVLALGALLAGCGTSMIKRKEDEK